MKKYIKTPAFFMLAVLILTLLAELFIFNFTSFKLNGDYAKTTLSLENATLSGFEYKDGKYVSTSPTPYIEFKNIDKKVGTIFADVLYTGGDTVNYTVDFTDETNSSYTLRTGLVSGTFTKGVDRTKYINCQFSGEVGNLKIKFSKFDGTVSFEENGIVLNDDIPMSFSFLRVGLIVLTVYLAYFLLKSKIAKEKLSGCPTSVLSITAAVCIICVITAFALTANITKPIAQEGGNQITKELVDAFASGKITLDREVEKELLELENPYDWSERKESGVSSAWDHVMYEGKYYSYYGIAPVVLLFLPFHLLTGAYFSSAWAVFIFGAVGLVFLVLFFKKLCERFFSDITLGVYVSALLTLVVSSGVWFCFMTPNFYEIAQNSGFMFVTLGAYFLVSSGIFSDKISKIKLCFSSVFFSLAVLCRPTTAVWCVAAVAFFAVHFIRIVKEKQPKIGYLCASLIPFAVIGGAQMIYNYARFDSFLDFGIQYSLTINDFTKSEFSPQMAFIGFYNFLFAFPVIKPEFPFIFSNFSDLGVNGYYFIANRYAIGEFIRVPAMLSYVLLPKAVKLTDKKHRVPFALLWLLCCVVLPFAVIYSIWESGYGVRYCVDFTWQSVVGAFIILFMLYRKYENNQSVRKIIECAFVISMFIALALNISMIWDYACNSLKISELSAELKNTFEFWK